MENFYAISEAAKLAGVTSETLRHYDRIGLVKPCMTDAWTGYRYYSKAEIVRLHTIQALRTMDLSLGEIKKVLDYDDLEQIIAFLRDAEERAEEKIAEIQRGKTRLQRARTNYEQKLYGRRKEGAPFLRQLPQRIILLSETLSEPTLDNLWNYLSHFYRQLPEEKREAFTFADTAGIYSRQGRDCLFAVCLRHGESQNLKTLPAGSYLCAACTEEDRAAVLARLLEEAKTQYGVTPEFTVQQIVITGILQWRYEVQVPIE